MPQINLTSPVSKDGRAESTSYEPACRLVSLFTAGSDAEAISDLALSLGRKAASLGETVLLLDAIDGELMNRAGIIYARTLEDVANETAAPEDALYVTSNEHFTAGAVGHGGLEKALGLLAALSLSYDWVFVVPKTGCEAEHVRLGHASDVSVLSYDTQGDQFMRAYWMMDAMRRRSFNFDPFILSMGQNGDAVETAFMLSEVIREHLGAPPPYAGHADDVQVTSRLLEQMREQVGRRAAV